MENFNPIWEEIFSHRDPSYYPYDNVVSFVFKNYPRNKPKNKINILEVGCGGGNNMLFLAQEGFNAFGIDGSNRALDIAKKRFSAAGLKATFINGDFTDLPFEDNFFDIVIDRCSIVCVNKSDGKKAIDQIHRVLLKNGKFFFNPYSDQHTSCTTASQLPSGITTGINKGTLIGNGDLSFYNKNELYTLFSSKWSIKDMRLKHFIDQLSEHNELHAEWELVLEKND